MYAVIMTGGKQYRVSQGDKVRVEKLDAAEGDSIELDKVLMVVDGDDIKIGAPVLDGGKVTAQVKAHGRGDKVEIIKFRRRKHHIKRQGHRVSWRLPILSKVYGPNPVEGGNDGFRDDRQDSEGQVLRGRAGTDLF